MAGWRRRVALGSLLGALALQPGSARGARVMGAALPDQVERVGPGRFRSLKSWDRTLRWFRRVYGDSEGLVWRRVDGKPAVEAFYLQNLRRGRTWDGIHVYRVARGPHEGIHIFVLPRADR
ncbi:MAG TPA: hypothetical protein RMG48_08960 [Myxococcales bacterium LLY-WYZ-16_1]|nr:hypothetical protein [Myxococcales bacterium LLY-WYZ-16_1]